MKKEEDWKINIKIGIGIAIFVGLEVLILNLIK